MIIKVLNCIVKFYAVFAVLILAACTDHAWNSPYPEADTGKNILYSSFPERPKHLDPARSYSANEYIFISQIYEPPLQYHYLKRPYALIPQTVTALPKVRFLDKHRRVLPDDAGMGEIASSVYEITLKQGIRYQPHPAFARNSDSYFYHSLKETEKFLSLNDFDRTGTRELTAWDYEYQIKRLAHPELHSPIYGVMAGYIVGLKEYRKLLRAAIEKADGKWLDLRDYPLDGVEVTDRYTYRITIRGKYPQFIYWLAMPFFSPVPWEADRFYAQPILAERNITLDWYPAGTGPFMLTLNNPNRKMVLQRNPNYHGEAYPATGEKGDAEQGLLADAGKIMPFVERIEFSLEKENIPYWNKFLQGYYDASRISSDSFDQAVQFTAQGDAHLTQAMEKKGIHLRTSVSTTIFYMGFNMLDPLIGGYTERARKLRQALSIAVDFEEYISIFANGRGIAAQGPLPPGIFGSHEGEPGINPYVYDWIDKKPRRKSVAQARRLLAEAGYPDGRDAKTGKPLVLHLDVRGSGPDSKARMDWYRKQFAKLDLQLVIRNTDYNRFQDKMRNGNAQIFLWGWNADYPDPENFLFLLYGPNGKVEKKGENAANYASPVFDRLFDQMKNMDNGPQRQAIIDEIIETARRDAPWIWGYHPKDFTLYHAWYANTKPNLMANNTFKYIRIDPQLREQKRAQWNKPLLWPLWLLGGAAALLLLPALFGYLRKEQTSLSQRGRKLERKL
ncbi:MAG: ABC transporter substrate-binding protein [Gammaproteobacteria bacterium]|nr:ABC transporter substrate-binding protein [Gammaproteobacteria bacterium]